LRRLSAIEGPFGQTGGRKNPFIATHLECIRSLGILPAKPIWDSASCTSKSECTVATSPIQPKVKKQFAKQGASMYAMTGI